MPTKKHANRAAVARYLQTVLKDRLRFTPIIQRAVLKGLNEQIQPVLNKLVTHHSSQNLDHLIKPEPIHKALEQCYNTVSKHFAKATYDGLVFGTKKALKTKDDGDEEEPEEFDEADFNKMLQAFIADVGADMVSDITDATMRKLQTYIAEAIKEGTGAAELAANIRKDFSDFNRVRSMLIARTEVARAQNFGTFAGGKMSGFELTKTWIHSGSSKYDRDSHEDADGQEVDMDDDFDIDSDYAPSYPHDGSGGADEECNCNCTFYTTRKDSNY